MLIDGYPGVRYRTVDSRGDRAIEFYLLDQPCAFLLHGIDVDLFENMCRGTYDGDDVQRMTTEPELQLAETAARIDGPHEPNALISTLVRRIGASDVDVYSVDLWPSGRKHLSIEILTSDRTPQIYRRLLSLITSPEVGPTITVLQSEGPAGYRTTLAVNGHKARVDLRIQTAPPR